jgi:hypothetical protein
MVLLEHVCLRSSFHLPKQHSIGIGVSLLAVIHLLV